jgi:hypothetical protein
VWALPAPHPLPLRSKARTVTRPHALRCPPRQPLAHGRAAVAPAEAPASALAIVRGVCASRLQRAAVYAALPPFFE